MAHEPSNLKDAVYNAILQDILLHAYEPGDILNEKKLVEKYGYSKAPIREALLSLCNDHVLRSIPRYGYEIIRITLEDVRDMLQFRYILESGVLSANLHRFGKSQLSRLESINEKCSASTDVWTHWEHNSDFHTAMLAICQNAYAVEELKRCMGRLKRAYAQFYQESLGTVALSTDTRSHAAILQCLKDRNLDGLLEHLKLDLNDFGGLQYAFGLRIGDGKGLSTNADANPR